MEELQKRLQETLKVLTPQELSSFRIILKTVDEEPRVSPLQLELQGQTVSGLASLLAKHYYLPAAPRVLTKVLKRLHRADLLPRWQSDPTADSPVIPRKILKRSFDCVESELELMDKLTSFRDGLNEMKDEIGCCVVTLMSHGEKGFIKMKDGARVSLEDVFEMFNNKNCPGLHEKPKIFIIQACRGEKRDNGIETDDEPMQLDDISEKRRLPTFSDYFIIYPTQADHVALRHSRTGSVMIEKMIDVYKQYGNKWHIVDFFTKVNNRVVRAEFYIHEEPIKVSLVMESTLTRFVYF
ncbi:PREDICTED: caspase-14-like isoform X2 [Hipposideros armiger]|uniref:Caspase-14-like isoform X2 n=1 Tax=Hipposideros armiger TaxID=186990 RepID=A0A8B7T1E8_HIPAR|nr:PREDICTED: caspase-14-like isoform X2 [Hipposideros armiger]